jgi:hypothetical protein
LRAPPAKLHQDPPLSTTTLYLPAAPHIALLSRTRSNARHSPVVFHFTATCPIARRTSSQPSHSHFLLLPCIPASLRSFCYSCRFCCPHSAVVSQPSQTRSCPTPSPPEEPETLAPARCPSWPFARPPPKRGGSRRCSTSPKGRKHVATSHIGQRHCAASKSGSAGMLPRTSRSASTLGRRKLGLQPTGERGARRKDMPSR